MPTFCTLRPNLELSTQITFDGDRCRFDSSFYFSKQFIEFIFLSMRSRRKGGVISEVRSGFSVFMINKYLQYDFDERKLKKFLL
jgi:hypothetical protein